MQQDKDRRSGQATNEQVQSRRDKLEQWRRSRTLQQQKAQAQEQRSPSRGRNRSPARTPAKTFNVLASKQ